MIIFLILGFVLGAAAIVFILQNTAIIAVTFLGWQFESSVAIILALSILIGIVLCLLGSIPGAIGSSIEIGKLKKDNRKLLEEIERMRQAPQAVIVTEQIDPVLDIRNS